MNDFERLQDQANRLLAILEEVSRREDTPEMRKIIKDTDETLQRVFRLMEQIINAPKK